MTGAVWKEPNRGTRSDEIKARLTPHIVDILRTGKYDGKSEPYKERKDGFVAFHFFEKKIDLSDIIVTAGVNVGQRDSWMYELTAYGLGHSPQEVWAKRKASDSPGNEPGTEAFQSGLLTHGEEPREPTSSGNVPTTLDKTIANDKSEVNDWLSIWVMGCIRTVM